MMIKNSKRMTRNKLPKVLIALFMAFCGLVASVRGQAYTRIEEFIALHETWKEVGTQNGKPVVYLYNQFNPVDYVDKKTGKILVPAGTPNMSSDGKGWGIGQITSTSYTDGIVPTAVVWDWRSNIVEMIRIIEEKRGIHDTYIARQKRLCLQNGFTWVDPPATYTTNGITLPSKEWGALILYNGGGTNAIPLSEGLLQDGTPSKLFRSPWKFYPSTTTWILYDNDNKYMRKATDKVNLMNSNGVIVKE